MSHLSLQPDCSNVSSAHLAHCSWSWTQFYTRFLTSTSQINTVTLSLSLCVCSFWRATYWLMDLNVTNQQLPILGSLIQWQMFFLNVHPTRSHSPTVICTDGRKPCPVTLWSSCTTSDGIFRRSLFPHKHPVFKWRRRILTCGVTLNMAAPSDGIFDVWGVYCTEPLKGARIIYYFLKACVKL